MLPIGRAASHDRFLAPHRRPHYSLTPQKHYVYDQSAGNGSMGRLGHAYTCPASPSNCSTWTTDLGFVYSSRGELTDVYELTPNSNGGYYHVSASYWANGLINTLNTRLGTLPTWTYNPEGEGRVKTVIASSRRARCPQPSYNLLASLRSHLRLRRFQLVPIRLRYRPHDPIPGHRKRFLHDRRADLERQRLGAAVGYQ